MELRQADIGDVRTVDDGAGIIHVKGKGGKDRTVPVEADLLTVMEAYLDSRATRFPDAVTRQAGPTAGGLPRWPVTSQRYVTAVGTETRTAAAQNRMYELAAAVAATAESVTDH